MAAGWVGCNSVPGDVTNGTAALGQPSPNQTPIDGQDLFNKTAFTTQLPIPKTFAPTVIRNGAGQVIRNEYTITDSQVQVQMLPAGYPTTTVLAMGGPAVGGGTVQSAPGAKFESKRGIPTVVHWRTNIGQPSFLEIDPTIHWADPQAIEKPTPPFNLFPPGYQNANYPMAHVTHTHGLVVLPQFDGTAEEWFTNVQYRGPSFVSEDYTMPNDQPSTQLFYHDHIMGITRLGIYAGEVGVGYFIRDPNAPLDKATSPLPSGQFEIPLTIFTRQFYTDGELAFPPDRGELTAGEDAPDNIAYWTYDQDSDVAVVNGASWPNLNVQPRQYRFRTLMAGNNELFDLQLQNNTTQALVPFTIIGADGGYLPAPQVVTDVQMGITERADLLVDFSQFPAGTKITMINSRLDAADSPLHFVMQFTVQGGTPAHPPALNPALFPAKPVLTADAPTRIKILRTFSDLRVGDDDVCAGQSVNCNQRALDGLEFTTPTTEYPEVGSTEEWDLVNITGGDEDDPDHQFHQIHIHLLEFQVINRQPFDDASYVKQWHLINGHMPVSRPIVVDPAPYFTGPAVPPRPVETGWKDTIQTDPGFITRIMVRWAPQEVTTSTPGVNQYSIDPSSFPDNVTGPGYVWHCHIVGHEDHDMMRTLAVVRAWKAGTAYKAGNVIAFNNVDYRARAAFTAAAGQTPNTRFDLWDRVNNNDGSWQPQIRYAANDRVTFNGQLFAARSVFQSANGQTPAANPSLWQTLPMTACAQLAQFCQGSSNPTAVQCRADGQAGNDATCLAEIEPCLSFCQPQQATPCSGLCNNPTRFSVADGSNFQSGNLGAGASCFETTSRLFQGESSSFAAGKSLTINGRPEPLNGNWNYPLPPMRNDGYCIQVSAGNNAFAAFAAW
ncbi:MAG TPA: carbohydrate-binding protein [Polyangia bacterium]